MTMREDPNIPRRTINADNQGWGTGSIILASLAALAVVFGLFFMMTGRNPTVADRPAVTTPATTTGSGNSAIPANPNGTAPQRDVNKPAPAPTNR